MSHGWPSLHLFGPGTWVTVVAVVLDAESAVKSGKLKASDVRGPNRAGRVFGWYVLPKSDELGLREMIVDRPRPS